MISVEAIAGFAGTSVEKVKELADRISMEVDFRTDVYETYSQGQREIVVPLTAFDRISKNLHRSLSRELPYAAPGHVHGFVKGRSAYTNAAQHLNQDCVLRVDLRKFFPSIGAARVQNALERQGLAADAADLCTRVCTIRDSLPIGLSTSPLLSNLVFEPTDEALSSYCDSTGLVLTRYVDDIVVSGRITDQNLDDVSYILEANGWEINPYKTAFMRRGGPQYVTGLYVGCSDRPRIPRRIKRQMRRACFLIEQFGYDVYMSEFGGSDARMIPNRLFGWARHIASIEPELGFPMLRQLSANVPERYPHSTRPDEYPGVRIVTDLSDLE